MFLGSEGGTNLKNKKKTWIGLEFRDVAEMNCTVVTQYVYNLNLTILGPGKIRG